MNPDTHNPLPALRALAKYGVPKSSATYLQNNYWAVPNNYLSIFGSYYIHYWSVDYFRDGLVDGMISSHDKAFQVIYHRTNPAEIKKHKGQVVLSFRELKHEYDVQAVVLVSLDKKGG